MLFCAQKGRGLAAATATATIVTGVVTVAIIDQQQDNDDEQDPGAVITTKQVSQTHTLFASFHRLQSILCRTTILGHK